MRRTDSSALNGVNMESAKQPAQRQQSTGRSCTAVSRYRILICADDATNRAKRSASQIAPKGRSYASMCQLNSLRNRTCRHTEPGGALLGFPSTSLLCRTQADIPPTGARLTALVTSYKAHKIPHHLILALGGSRVFFCCVISIFFVINQDYYFLSSRC